MLLQFKCWVPDREILAFGDNSFAVIDLLAALAGKGKYENPASITLALTPKSRLLHRVHTPERPINQLKELLPPFWKPVNLIPVPEI